MSETYALSVILISEKPFPHLTAFKCEGSMCKDGNGSSETARGGGSPSLSRHSSVAEVPAGTEPPSFHGHGIQISKYLHAVNVPP